MIASSHILCLPTLEMLQDIRKAPYQPNCLTNVDNEAQREKGTYLRPQSISVAGRTRAQIALISQPVISPVHASLVGQSTDPQSTRSSSRLKCRHPLLPGNTLILPLTPGGLSAFSLQRAGSMQKPHKEYTVSDPLKNHHSQ